MPAVGLPANVAAASGRQTQHAQPLAPPAQIMHLSPGISTGTRLMRLMLAAIALLAAPALAQETQIPRTPDGRPDLQGFWSSHFMTPLERPEGMTGLIVPRDQSAEALKKMTPDIGEVYDPELEFNPFPGTLLEMNGELRSSLLTQPEDGLLPYTALAKATMDHFKPEYDNPEDRPGAERCTDSLNYPPYLTNSELIPHQIVQTPTAVVLATEDLDAARIVSLAGPAPPDSVRTLVGQARGVWEGDTLVVTTSHIRITDRRGVSWRGDAMITEDSRIIERFRLLSADELLYQFTIEDPSLYKSPWLGEYVMTRSRRPVYEYACHEGNHALYGILGAARLGKQDKKKAN